MRLFHRRPVRVPQLYTACLCGGGHAETVLPSGAPVCHACAEAFYVGIVQFGAATARAYRAGQAYLVEVARELPPSAYVLTPYTRLCRCGVTFTTEHRYALMCPGCRSIANARNGRQAWRKLRAIAS